MEHNKTSIEEIVGRVIRNTRIPETSAYADIFVWITEAMADMRTKWSLQRVWAHTDVHFFKAEMPCRMQVISAVEYEGMRLQQRNLSRAAQMVPSAMAENPTYWISAVQATMSPAGFTTYTQETRSIPIMFHDVHWYQEDGPGFLDMSMESGLIIIHGKQVPHDKHGWPLIPDQENYKEALYWYCRMKLIESGWQDPVLDWDRCYALYNTNAERGRAAIRFPSTNRMEELCDMTTLIPPQNYFDSFENFYQP